MKNNYLLLTFLICLVNIQNTYCQYVNISNVQFRAFLQTLYPSCFNDQNLMDTTCSEIVNEEILQLEGSSFTDISGIQYFDSLKSLVAYSNSLSELPKMPSRLELLAVEYNQLLTLPKLPTTLKRLLLDYNPISSLPSLPKGLEWLYCTGCNINTLPTLPDSLTNLYIAGNKITQFPALPINLKYCVASNNMLSGLPDLPSKLVVLEADGNCFMAFPTNPYPLTLYSFIVSPNSNNCVVTSDTEYSHVNDIAFYPNPVKNKMNFSTNCSYTVFSLQGIELLKGNAEYVDLEKLSNGIYLIKINEDIHKFVKE